jgi:FkbM family methyltransferase
LPTIDIRSLARKHLLGTNLLETLAGRVQRKVSYSQFGEDLHLRSFYDRLAHDRGIVVTGGCIVDIGAFRPIAFSNSYGFYRRGWPCINIEPTPGSVSIFNKMRPRDINLEVAIGPIDGTGPFFLFGQPSVWNTMDPGAAKAATQATGITPCEIPVRIRRLEAILDEHLDGRSFELLLIDAEGYDIEILKSNNFAKFSPRLILIEVHNVALSNLLLHPVVRYLSGFGYQLHSWINPNLLFVREDSLLDVSAPKR